MDIPTNCPECGQGRAVSIDTEVLEDYQDGLPPAPPNTPGRYAMGMYRRNVPGATSVTYSCGHRVPQ